MVHVFECAKTRDQINVTALIPYSILKVALRGGMAFVMLHPAGWIKEIMCTSHRIQIVPHGAYHGLL